MSENPNIPTADETPEPIVVRSEIGDKPSSPAPEVPAEEEDSADMKPRLERLGGEPAPDITPEEFARLQQSGQIHIDPRGRVRSTRATDADAGVSLRKRRAWYGNTR
jgi:hypothetical protein